MNDISSWLLPLSCALILVGAVIVFAARRRGRGPAPSARPAPPTRGPQMPDWIPDMDFGAGVRPKAPASPAPAAPEPSGPKVPDWIPEMDFGAGMSPKAPAPAAPATEPEGPSGPKVPDWIPPMDFGAEPGAGQEPPLPQPIVLDTEPPVGPSEPRGVEDLYKHAAEIVDLLVTEQDECILLDKTGKLIRWRGLSGLGTTTFQISGVDPLALARPNEGDVLVVGRNKRALIVTYQKEAAPAVKPVALDVAVRRCAANPFGTLLVFATAEESRVYGRFLAAAQNQVLAETHDLPTALAFSPDGRLLAAGCHDGQVEVIDMATRQVVRVLPPPAAAHVVALGGLPGGGWAVAHDGGALGGVDARGEPLRLSRETRSLTALAVDAQSGRVAVGDTQGRVWVYGDDLGALLFNGQAYAAPVVRLVFREGGQALIGAARDGALRKVTL